MPRVSLLLPAYGKRWMLSSLMLLFPLSAQAENAGEEARAILVQAVSREKDAAFLEESLMKVEALATRSDADSVVHYTRGWLLSHLQRPTEAIAAYQRATQTPPPLAEAAYNLGVLLSAAGRADEALRAYDEAIRLQPDHVDALYNAGQSNYNLQRYGAALAKWRAAQKLSPDDFQIARKILQSLNALGFWEEAALARDEAVQIWREKRDPAVTKLTQFCFDQIPAPTHHIFAFERFTTGEDGVVLRINVTDLSQKKTLHVLTLKRLEGSRHVLSVDKNDTISSREFADRPTWRELKPVVRSITEELMAAPAS
ncbi:MAG: hypothetical protein C0518_14125 [Opitutus sp.]|nr:hypothetical protein [Opitutus sp.]